MSKQFIKVVMLALNDMINLSGGVPGCDAKDCRICPRNKKRVNKAKRVLRLLEKEHAK